jgi:sugar phosphate isomerase/epimerase
VHAALAPLTVGRPAPAVLVAAAAAGGFDQVGLTLWTPGAGAPAQLCSDGRLRRSLRRQLDGSGVAALDVGVVVLSAELDQGEVARTLECGRELGADRVIVMNQDPEPGRAVAALAAVCDQAAQLELLVGVEFMPYSASRTLAQAVALVAATAAPTAGVVLDLLHLHRSGSVPQLAALDPRLVHLVQLCDGHQKAPAANRLREEALGDRLYPGHGGLLVPELEPFLSPGVPVTVEAPVRADADRSAAVRARSAAEALGALARRCDRLAAVVAADGPGQ